VVHNPNVRLLPPGCAGILKEVRMAGRPKLPRTDSRSEALRFRVRPAEAAALRDLAQALGQTPSRVLRRLLREAITHGPDYFADQATDFHQTSEQLARIGRNLNQLVRAINQGNQVAPAELRRVVNAAHLSVSAASHLYREAVLATKQRQVVALDQLAQEADAWSRS